MEEDIKIVALESFHSLDATAQVVANSLEVVLEGTEGDLIVLPKSTLRGIIKVIRGQSAISRKLVEHQAQIDDELEKLLQKYTNPE